MSLGRLDLVTISSDGQSLEPPYENPENCRTVVMRYRRRR